MKWYVVYVETSKESLVSLYLNKYFKQLDLRCFFPMRKVPERVEGSFVEVVKPLFPGYVFVYAQMNPDLYTSINKIPRIFRILRKGKYSRTDIDSYYTEIDEKEIEPILGLVGNDGIIDYSQAIATDNEIVVTSGPLKGREELIKKINKRKMRAKIELNLLGAQCDIDVGLNIVNNSE
ncbi:antiterminator LoaP [Paenibacillus amylolyticus]|uniref:antiterminator LoaP n=1 Tax=Paenibacillus amylolyticus TaxID=1451 RepID=UPI003EBC30A8